jgi:hypothetical protein
MDHPAQGGTNVAAKPFAFVLMPFEQEFSDIYKLGIQAVAKDCGVIAERVDEQTYTESILERIYRQIENADFIIAEMTGRNPNVFYEVGYAHARGKLVTLLTQSADDIPFDLRHHRHIIYDGSIQTLQGKLRTEIEWLKKLVKKQKSTTFTMELRSAVGDLERTPYSDTALVELVFDIHNKTNRRSPDIEAIYIYTGKGWTFSQGGEECPFTSSDELTDGRRHFIRSPVPRLSPGAWAQINLRGKKDVWSKWLGDEQQTSYTTSGIAILELSTSEGTFREDMHMSVEHLEIPF